MAEKRAFITGVTGQDGAYLAQLLLEKGYRVFGACRSVLANTWRLAELGVLERVTLIPLDLMDFDGIRKALLVAEPSEIYNLAAQSFIGNAFEDPIYTGEINGLGVCRLLEAVRQLAPEARFYQASSSLLYGNPTGESQNENTPFRPCNPYSAAKLYAHWLTVNYRENFGLFACAGILFNHESPLRGLEFVTRKIVRGLAQFACGTGQTVMLGSLESRRDWGFAGDYVRGMWLMLQQDEPGDFVLATGRAHSVRELVETAARHYGIELRWDGQGDSETSAYNASTGEKVIGVESSFFRPSEVVCLKGDATKAKVKLGWEPSIDFSSLIEMMAKAELARVQDLKPGHDSCLSS